MAHCKNDEIEIHCNRVSGSSIISDTPTVLCAFHLTSAWY